MTIEELHVGDRVQLCGCPNIVGTIINIVRDRILVQYGFKNNVCVKATYSYAISSFTQHDIADGMHVWWVCDSNPLEVY